MTNFVEGLRDSTYDVKILGIKDRLDYELGSGLQSDSLNKVLLTILHPNSFIWHLLSVAVPHKHSETKMTF